MQIKYFGCFRIIQPLLKVKCDYIENIHDLDDYNPYFNICKACWKCNNILNKFWWKQKLNKDELRLNYGWIIPIDVGIKSLVISYNTSDVS